MRRSRKIGGTVQLFERILLDAPCSALGVIRRHPDIKLLRRADDIGQLQALQKRHFSTLSGRCWRPAESWFMPPVRF